MKIHPLLAIVICWLLFIGVDEYLLNNAGMKFFLAAMIYIVPAGLLLAFTAFSLSAGWRLGKRLDK